jgi:hypothetical protein
VPPTSTPTHRGRSPLLAVETARVWAAMSGDCRRGIQAFILLRAPSGSPTVAIGRGRPFSGIRRLDLAHGKVTGPGRRRSCRFANGLATLSIMGPRYCLISQSFRPGRPWHDRCCPRAAGGRGHG